MNKGNNILDIYCNDVKNSNKQEVDKIYDMGLIFTQDCFKCGGFGQLYPSPYVDKTGSPYPCDACSGTKVIDSALIKCPKCIGDGMLFPFPNRSGMPYECSICYGKGHVNQHVEICNSCDGEGKVFPFAGRQGFPRVCHICCGNGAFVAGGKALYVNTNNSSNTTMMNTNLTMNSYTNTNLSEVTNRRGSCPNMSMPRGSNYSNDSNNSNNTHNYNILNYQLQQNNNMSMNRFDQILYNNNKYQVNDCNNNNYNQMRKNSNNNQVITPFDYDTEDNNMEFPRSSSNCSTNINTMNNISNTNSKDMDKGSPVNTLNKSNNKNTPNTPDDEGKLCIICMESQRNTVLNPCGHVLCCESCVNNIFKGKYGEKPCCPVCRETSINYLKLIIS